MHDGVFVDLGSGEGGVVLSTLRRFPSLKRAIGVELARERHEVAIEEAAQCPNSVASRATFIDGDICDESHLQVMDAVRSARVIFVSNVMFDACLMDRLSRVLRRHAAREGRAVVVVAHGQKLDLGNRPKAHDSGLMLGSWGLAPVYLYGLLPEKVESKSPKLY